MNTDLFEGGALVQGKIGIEKIQLVGYQMALSTIMTREILLRPEKSTLIPNKQ